MSKNQNFYDWESMGHYAHILNHKIFYVDHNPTCESVICILHGYPTCSYDYHHLLQYLPNFRIIIHDHLGFGLSDKPQNSKYLLAYQADIALKLYDHLNLQTIDLLAHDYGTSIATEIIARDNSKRLALNINKIILSNGSMLIEMSKLRFIQKLLKNKFLGPIIARIVSQNTFIRNMQNIWFNSDSIDKNELETLWLFLIHNNGRKVLPVITRYIDQRYDNYYRWIGALKSTEKEVLLLWGDNDPVAIVEMVKVLESMIKNSRKVILKDTGHYPMIENVTGFSKAINNFI